MQPKAPRLYLLRHAQAMLGTDNYDRLSERGRLQADHLGRRVGSELPEHWLAWSGALNRQRSTLAALRAPGLTVIDPCLNEYRVDRMVAHAVEQAGGLELQRPPAQALTDPVAFLDLFLTWFPLVLERWQQGALQDPCNGTWAAFRKRTLQPVSTWQRHIVQGHSVVVVSSAGVISTIVAALTGRGLEWQRQLNVSLYNSSFTELVPAGQGRWNVERINCVAHLKEESLHTLA
jgi:broad specificity phosphatase PhoE